MQGGLGRGEGGEGRGSGRLRGVAEAKLRIKKPCIACPALAISEPLPDLDDPWLKITQVPFSNADGA